jgi:methyl-accepting chemotaxis protein
MAKTATVPCASPDCRCKCSDVHSSHCRCARIIAIAVIPVVGLLANGLVFISSEREVSASFQTVKQSAALADASREFKNAIAEMRIAVKDFVATPREDFIRAFETADFAAHKALGAIGSSTEGQRADDINGLLTQLADIKKNFDQLVKEQRILGFGDFEGLRRLMIESGSSVERVINEQMPWLAEGDARKLMMLLLSMRHFEAEYRLSSQELMRALFFQAYKKFNDTFDSVDGTDQMKNGLQSKVKLYADIFEQWIEVFNRAYPLQALIDIDSQNLLPRADVVIESAQVA